MRPYYEQRSDLDNEQRVALAIKEECGLDWRKLSITYRLDAALLRDGVIDCFAEVKARKVKFGAYSTMMVSALKVDAAKRLTAISGRPCYFVIAFDDCIAACDFAAAHDTGLGGRADRLDAQDSDVCAYYRIKYFKPLAKIIGTGAER